MQKEGRPRWVKARGRERRAVGAKSPLKEGNNGQRGTGGMEVWGRGRGQGTPGGGLFKTPMP